MIKWYCYSMMSACDVHGCFAHIGPGQSGSANPAKHVHPTKDIRQLAPEAFHLVPESMFDSWFFRSPELTNPPRHITEAPDYGEGLKERAYPGLCISCGCTDRDCSECIKRWGKPCSWANTERTLCTACVGLGLAP